MHDRVMPSTPKRAPHEVQLDEMHDALYRLRSEARPAISGDGTKLLPEELVPDEDSKAGAAKRHIGRLHKAFKSLKKGKEK